MTADIWEAKLRARYERVEVPVPLRTMDAEDEQVARQADDFFQRLARSLMLSDLAIGVLVHVDVRMLIPPYIAGIESIKGSDDFIQELQIEGVQTLASMLRTRDDLNFQVAHFAKYALLPRSVEIIREIDRLEGYLINPRAD